MVCNTGSTHMNKHTNMTLLYCISDETKLITLNLWDQNNNLSFPLTNIIIHVIARLSIQWKKSLSQAKRALCCFFGPTKTLWTGFKYVISSFWGLSMKEPLFYVSLAHTLTHILSPHLGLTVWQSEILAWWRAGEGGQGRKGSQVPQTSIKLTGTPVLKLCDPPQNLVSLLLADTQTHTHTHKNLPGLKSSPAAKKTSSL